MKKFTPRRLVLAALACVTVATMSLALFSTNSRAAGDKPAQPAARPALTVTTVQPAETSMPLRLAANGNVAAWQEAIIGSEASGLRLAEVAVNVGDVVKAGQVLARFAAETVQADVAQAQANLQEAEARVQEAASNAERARVLQASGAMSRQEASQLLTGELTAKARVAAAKATLQTQQLRLKQTRVLAPDNGVISARSATVGAVSGVGAELFRMIRQGRLEWRAEVTTAELPRIRTGSKAGITAANGTKVTGTVRMVAPTVDVQSRSALVYVDLPSSPASTPQQALVRAGMFARGEFDLGETTALTLPQQAVVLRDGFTYVFRLNPDSRVSQLKVRTGRRLDERVEVVEGIKPQDRLVASGAGFLNEGDLVKVVTASAPATAPAPAQPAAR
ncbi:efflux RND transporter periplasmic adaptor subunit [Janthinobacterium sp. 17J80-10]|uniref:efflux RND transporter periplasmic adaptor subunit n=1 Tax=Janthinobacterium sp. 17J80-10 TaxID=2497863 RepID=UPI0010058E9F|nr:efflux RND transporter periplasmic adaptor subunit [Janthinobacterium sp. 17J80-10]QAU33444.1 efflux RND transporter periplasmic adaptor subunit [Janthinobacterium sp. 17J80-10]